MAFKGDDSTLSLATTVTLALAVAAMVLTKNPLQSSRPPGSATGLQQVTGELSVHARLWEDPFAAVEKAVEAQRQISVQVTVDDKQLGRVTVRVAPSAQGDDGLESLRRKIGEADSSSIAALVVMTQGGFSVEASEARIRDRYAVSAALEAGCFAPDKAESLSYFRWDSPKASNSVQQYTPYEWYERSVIGSCLPRSELFGNPGQVLVLWVKAQEGEDRILARISELVSKFPSLSVRLVGPRTSSEFRSILKEIGKEYSRPPKHWSVLRRDPKESYSWQESGKSMPVYSPWATAMPSLLLRGLKEEESGQTCQSNLECEKSLNQPLERAGLVLSYRVTTDEVLFESVLEELERRQVKIGQDRIVLIGEWDSFYARALPLTFTAAACQHVTRRSKELRKFTCTDIQAGIASLLNATLSPKDLNIVQYSYLSGLDGETVDDQAKKTKSKEGDKTKDREKGEGNKGAFRDIASYERPEGPSQLDYVRRLVTRIKAEIRDGDQEGNQPNGKVKAIGILGRDPYDALLILQALREEFPNVLFFATDLDARYFHEDEQKWTRNLIVASQFGLQLEPSLQQSIPPFRHSLQTSTFFAVLQAIGRVRLDAPSEKPKFTLSGQDATYEFSTDIAPRLFEIGRHGAVDLSPAGQMNGLPTIHPVRTDVNPRTGAFNPPPKIGLLWIVGLTLGFLMLWGYGRLWNWMTARDEPDPAKRRLEWIPRFSWVAIPVVLGLAVTCWIAHLETYAEEEPFSWTDGVSIWPTEALRFIAICLCLLFLLKARADSARNIGEITKSFFPGLPSQVLKIGRHAALKGFWGDLNWMFHGSKHDQASDAGDLWARYCRAHRWLPRAARIALGLGIYFCLILPLVWVMNGGEFRLAVPCRGEFSCAVDSIALTASVLAFLILNLALLDAVILCTKWIQEIPSAKSSLTSMQKIRLIVERSTVVNRRVLHPFLVLFLLIAARNHYFDNWDFPPVLLLALTVNSLVLITSASLLYLAAVQAKRRILASIQEQLDRAMAPIEGRGLAPIKVAAGPSSDRLRQLITDIDAVQQGAFVPFYQQPMVQATLVAALAFLQYWYLGQ